MDLDLNEDMVAKSSENSVAGVRRKSITEKESFVVPEKRRRSSFIRGRKSLQPIYESSAKVESVIPNPINDQVEAEIKLQEAYRTNLIAERQKWMCLRHNAEQIATDLESKIDEPIQSSEARLTLLEKQFLAQAPDYASIQRGAKGRLMKVSQELEEVKLKKRLCKEIILKLRRRLDNAIGNLDDSGIDLSDEGDTSPKTQMAHLMKILNFTESSVANN